MGHKRDLRLCAKIVRWLSDLMPHCTAWRANHKILIIVSNRRDPSSSCCGHQLRSSGSNPRSRTQCGWQTFGGVLIIPAAAALITKPADPFRWRALVVAAVAVFGALIMILRPTGLLVTNPVMTPLRTRQVSGVLIVILSCVAVTTAATSAVVAVAANPSPPGSRRANGGSSSHRN